MNKKRVQVAVQVAVLGAAAMLPVALMGQMDPSQSPNSPSNMNQPSGQPGMSNSTGSGASPSTGSMRDSLGAPGATGQEMADKQFLHNAAEGGIAEVQLGMLAVQKGGPDVKAFGQKMVDDHTTMNKDMGAVADSMGVMLPKKVKKEDQAEYDKLNGLSGDAFDKEYITYMVKEHYADIRAFRMEATMAADPGLQAQVVKAAMMMRQHIMILNKLATDKGVPLPPRPQRPQQPPPAGQ